MLVHRDLDGTVLLEQSKFALAVTIFSAPVGVACALTSLLRAEPKLAALAGLLSNVPGLWLLLLALSLSGGGWT